MCHPRGLYSGRLWLLSHEPSGMRYMTHFRKGLEYSSGDVWVFVIGTEEDLSGEHASSVGYFESRKHARVEGKGVSAFLHRFNFVLISCKFLQMSPRGHEECASLINQTTYYHILSKLRCHFRRTASLSCQLLDYAFVIHCQLL